jgi:hypothetical protein
VTSSEPAIVSHAPELSWSSTTMVLTLEGTVPDQLGIDAAITRVVDVLEEQAMKQRRGLVPDSVLKIDLEINALVVLREVRRALRVLGLGGDLGGEGHRRDEERADELHCWS